MAIRSVGVIGLGIMGGGITQVCASHGYDVLALEANDHSIQTGLARIEKRLNREVDRNRVTAERAARVLQRVKGTTRIYDLRTRELVIEAVSEDLELKASVFSQLGKECKDDAILASNTSSLSLSSLAAASGRAERVIGLHFFNPPTALRLVEVISSQSTSQETIDEAMAFCDSIDRLTVQVKDTPGFIVNRLLMPFIFDAIRMLEGGTANAEDIDQGCKVGLNHAMGPLATADLIGLDTLE